MIDSRCETNGASFEWRLEDMERNLNRAKRIVDYFRSESLPDNGNFDFAAHGYRWIRPLISVQFWRRFYSELEESGTLFPIGPQIPGPKLATMQK